MPIIYNILNHLRNSGASEPHTRQYRLIFYLTWELIAVAIIIITFYALSKLWLVVFILTTALIIALINLWILVRTKNTVFCSHIVALVVYLTIISTNFLLWGIGPLHSQWFYVMPLIAASLLGINGLFIYSIASMVLLIIFDKFAVPPYYLLPAYQYLIIEWINHIFAYLVIVTTLASLLHENQRYEQELNDKNYLLQIEKDRYHHLSRIDPLTNLPNRRYFIQHLHEIIDSISANQCVTVFFIDIDNFKLINDRYGHTAGDQVLLETSKRLKFCFQENDFIARLGGDEFTAMVLHVTNKQIPITIAERIINEFQKAFIFENQVEYHYSISLGFATFPYDAQTASDLIACADYAMYAAKKISGSSYCSINECISNEKPREFKSSQGYQK